MEKVVVKIGWAENNYSAVCENINGVVVDTHKDLDKLKESFKKTLDFHIEGSLEDGDSIPEAIAKGNYELVFELEMSALLHKLDGILTRASLSRVTGINEKQLGHYMSGHRKPRPKQKERIIEGIHSIGEELMSVV